MKEEDLPEEMKKMTIGERKAHVAKKKTEREAVNKQISEVAQKRQACIDEEVKKNGLAADKAFDGVIKESLRKQAEKKNFKFE
jgi:hypothetical protein